MTVKEAAALAGISARAMRYYEEVGLIAPARGEENGYRDYDQDTVVRARIIRAYRELGFSLEETRALLHASRMERDAMLEKQINQLKQKKKSLENRMQIAATIRMLGPERLADIDLSTLDEQMAQAEENMESNEQLRQMSERFKAESAERWQQIKDGLIERFVKIANAPECDVPENIFALKAWIEDNFYPCTKEMLGIYARSYGGDGLLAQALDDVGGAGTSQRMRERVEKWLDAQS